MMYMAIRCLLLFFILSICCGFRGSISIAQKTRPISSLNLNIGSSTERLLVSMSKLDIRLGKVVDCKVHPEDPGCYVCAVDVKEAEPRIVVSRLAAKISAEKMFNRDRLVVMCCNVMPVAVGGIVSQGNLFHVVDFTERWDLLYVPCRDGEVGAAVSIEGINFEPLPPSLEVNYEYFSIREYLKVSDSFNAKMVHRMLNDEKKRLDGRWYSGEAYILCDSRGPIRLANC